MFGFTVLRHTQETPGSLGTLGIHELSLPVAGRKDVHKPSMFSARRSTETGQDVDRRCDLGVSGFCFCEKTWIQ